MATFSLDALNAYCNRVQSVQDTGAKRWGSAIRKWMLANRNATVAQIRNFAIYSMEEYIEQYGTMSAELAASMWDLTSLLASGDQLTGEISTVYDRDALSKYVHYEAGKITKGDIEGFISRCSDYIHDQVGEQANETTIKMVKKQNASSSNSKKVSAGNRRWGRVLQGEKNCSFCTMLSSRGFVYYSEEDASYRHAHCDCKVVAGSVGDRFENQDELYDNYEVFKVIDSTYPHSEAADRRMAYAEASAEERTKLREEYGLKPATYSD